MSEALPRVQVLAEGHDKLCAHPVERVAWHTRTSGSNPAFVIVSCRTCGRSLSLAYDRLMTLDDLMGTWPMYLGKPL